jgi:dTMP kinase
MAVDGESARVADPSQPGLPVNNRYLANVGENAPIVSIEGFSGVGKTRLVRLIANERFGRAQLSPRVLAGYPVGSRRDDRGCEVDAVDSDLGRRLSDLLISWGGGDPFLRGGYPMSETMLLLAANFLEYEKNVPAKIAGQALIEDRGLYTLAVYQSLILHPADNSAALSTAQDILALAAMWRPLPDVPVVLADDLYTAIRRAELRDNRRLTGTQVRMQARAAWMFEHLADRYDIPIFDRRSLTLAMTAAALVELVNDAYSAGDNAKPKQPK